MLQELCTQDIDDLVNAATPNSAPWANTSTSRPSSGRLSDRQLMGGNLAGTSGVAGFRQVRAPGYSVRYALRLPVTG